jgi:hypothetical protein
VGGEEPKIGPKADQGAEQLSRKQKGPGPEQVKKKEDRV